MHLFHRRTGLNLLLDEIRVPPEHWAEAPRQLSIALTNACDLECDFCYAPKHHARLSATKIIDWLDELNSGGCVGIGFGGGEPTLHPDLPKLCEYAAQHTEMSVSLTTHGHHLDEDYVRSLAGNVHFVRISMDGVGQTYESVRGRSFQALISRLNSLRDTIRYGINYVVNSQTIRDIDAAIDVAENHGASEFLLLPQRASQNSPGIDIDTSLALKEWVDRYHGGVRLTVSESGADGLRYCDPFQLEKGTQGYAHIDASGFIKRTSFDLTGIAIGKEGVIEALKLLRATETENRS